MGSLSPKVRAMVGMMTVALWGGAALVLAAEHPWLAFGCGALALLRVRLLLKQIRRYRAMAQEDAQVPAVDSEPVN